MWTVYCQAKYPTFLLARWSLEKVELAIPWPSVGGATGCATPILGGPLHVVAAPLLNLRIGIWDGPGTRNLRPDVGPRGRGSLFPRDAVCALPRTPPTNWD